MLPATEPQRASATDSPVLITHANNYDFLRLLFATLVLVTHSYAILGLPEQDALWKWSRGQTSLSGLAVYGFFVLSGLMINKSLVRSSSLLEYYLKRALRILPGYWAVIVLVAILCYFVSDRSAWQYFTNWSTRDYILYGAVFRIQYYIEGTFKGIVWNSPNNSIWTIPYECLCYVLLSATFLFRTNKKLTRWLFCLLFAVLFVLLRMKLKQLHDFPNETFFGFSPLLLAEWGLFFTAGCILSNIKLPSTRVRNMAGWAALTVMLAGVHFEGWRWVQYLFLPPALVFIGSLKYPIISGLRKIGDVSYGVYLWGWPTQQFINYFFHPNYTQLLLLCIPASWIMGYISWKLIEERPLRLKLKL